MTVDQRIRKVLAAMAAVSEAPGQSVVMFDPNTHHGSSVPSGVRSSASVATLEPYNSSSLFDEWAERFDRAQSLDDRARSVLCTAAEAELHAYQHGHPGLQVDEYGDPTKAEEEFALIAYRGMDPEEAGVIQTARRDGTPNGNAAWIRRLRQRNSMHPETGEPRETGEGRLRKVAELRAQGLGAKLIAREIGCSPTTAQRVMRELDDQARAA